MMVTRDHVAKQHNASTTGMGTVLFEHNYVPKVQHCSWDIVHTHKYPTNALEGNQLLVEDGQ